MIWVCAYAAICLLFFITFIIITWYDGEDMDMETLFLFFMCAILPGVNVVALIAGLIETLMPEDGIIIRGRRK